ncbi:hypothetical protein B0H11DRAFT_2224875 [Mycena galericulata]|nr:hypothetical protein B0H11DRAFT_2224875 [Mycena galericulata]
MSSDSNQDKIKAYQSLSEAQKAEALHLFQKIPPVTLGGDSVKTKDMSETERKFRSLRRVTLVSDWVDKLVASVNFADVSVNYDQRLQMASALLEDRQKPFGPDRVERTVDDYHRRFILDPATKVAGIMMGKKIKVTYAPQTEGVATDLRVCDEEDTEDGQVNYIVAEDKRSRVWRIHESKLLALLEKETFPTFKPHETPPGEVRICVQIHVQMHKFQVFYGKILSPCGVIYVRRGVNKDCLEFSRVYHNLDDDVRRTACLIMEAEKHPQGCYVASLPASLRSFSKIWPICAIYAWVHRQVLQLLLLLYTLRGSPTVAIGPEGHWSLFEVLHSWQSSSLKFPSIFSKYLGAGASGDVWLSNDGKYVIKIFAKQDIAENEAEVLLTCQQYPEVAVPTFYGLYSDGWRFAVVTRYVGSTIGPFDDAEQGQRQQLRRILHALHHRGIHHHDVRPANVMVNKSGVVTLIDFDRASWVHGECKNCTDLQVMSSLEASIEEPEILPYQL